MASTDKTEVDWADVADAAQRTWKDAIRADVDPARRLCRLDCRTDVLRPLCRWLFGDLGYAFAMLVVEEDAGTAWSLAYVFYDDGGHGWVYARVGQEIADNTVPSISDLVYAADWHEREAEDLFGLEFQGHPKLGEFVLHEDWPEGVNPMRKAFDGRQRLAHRETDPEWRPATIVAAPGAFSMPVGPVFSDFAESAHFLLESVGEDVIVTIPRLFYKYRGVQKIAEGETVDRALLMAERFSGSAAFAHGLAFCMAVEAIAGVDVPPRARALRTVFAELERLRHHAQAVTGICASTALAVAASQAAIIEEELLRLSGAMTGHRYLFGLVRPGGLSLEVSDQACRHLASAIGEVLGKLNELERMLRYSSSFLDRLEQVGVVTTGAAIDYGLVGPIARASGVRRDLRQALPYASYDAVDFTVCVETEGDGYARLRVLFQEAAQSARIIRHAVADLPDGPVSAASFAPRAGQGLGAVEAPLGAAFHWLRLDDDVVARYQMTTPSFTNWHGFHLAAENFAFQDFPIIMATFGLSNAECDR